jgi:hypothetical protein
MDSTLHERLAVALGWSVADTQSFSLPALREMVRGRHPRLEQEINAVLDRGSHLTRPAPRVRSAHVPR